MKLQQFRALIAIVDHGTFSEAALELGVSQSTVSSAIAELEEELGVRLLERGHFGARPTAVGHRIVAQALRLESALDAVRQEASVERGALRGRLTINAFRSAAAHILPGVIAELRREHPDLTVSIHEREGQNERDVESLYEGRVDVAVVSSVIAGGALFWEFMRDPYVAIVPDRPDFPTGPVSLAEITLHPMILGDVTCCAIVDEALRRRDAAFRPEFQVTQDSTILAMVAQGLGVALMPLLAVDNVPAGVRQIELTDRLERRIGVALTPEGLKTPAVRAFLMLLRERFPEGEIPPLSGLSGAADESESEHDEASRRRAAPAR